MTIPKPKTPYASPFLTGPVTAVAYDVNDPTTEVVDKGTFWFHVNSKSTMTAPSVYVKRDVCGNEWYMKGVASLNANQLVNCIVTPVFQGSLSANIPIDMTRTEFDSFVAQMTDELWASTLASNFTDNAGTII